MFKTKPVLSLQARSAEIWKASPVWKWPTTPLSGSLQTVLPSSSKSRHRSKPRHRRGNSRGSHSDFAAILKTSPPKRGFTPSHFLYQANPENHLPSTIILCSSNTSNPTCRVTESPSQDSICTDRTYPRQQPEVLWSCSSLCGAHSATTLKAQMPGSSPDLISTAMAVRLLEKFLPDKGQLRASLPAAVRLTPRPRLQCRLAVPAWLPDVPLAKPGRSPNLFKPLQQQ